MPRKLTSYQRGWIVAFLEGEGCFDKTKEGKVRVRVTQADDAYECLEHLQQLLAGVIYPHRDNRPNHKPCHIWILQGEAAVALMRHVRRYMSAKRKRQIDKALTPLSDQERKRLNSGKRAAYALNPEPHRLAVREFRARQLERQAA